jgi:hypothetical protein
MVVVGCGGQRGPAVVPGFAAALRHVTADETGEEQCLKCLVSFLVALAFGLGLFLPQQARTPSVLAQIEPLKFTSQLEGVYQTGSSPVAAQIRRIEEQALGTVIPLRPVTVASDRRVPE